MYLVKVYLKHVRFNTLKSLNLTSLKRFQDIVCFPTVIHAKENLLRSNGRIIPGRVKLFVAGFQSRQLAMEQNLVNSR